MMLESQTLAGLPSRIQSDFHVGRLQNQGQEDIGRNLHLSQGVDERIALVAPEVPVVAGHKPIKIEEDGLPIPEPPITD